MASPPPHKRKSPEPDHNAAQSTDLTRTPRGSPVRKKPKITQSQKQALIDNLQLEITERARKLRAHHALQIQDLRARIERRVNRIPVALRKVRMGELLEKQNASAHTGEGTRIFKKPVLPSKPIKNVTTTISVDTEIQGSPAIVAKLQPQRVKRSDEGLFSDKENALAGADGHIPLINPKKRANPNATGVQSRAVSQVMREAEAKVLSPKSSNSRTFPQSPFTTTPGKPQQQSTYISRPASPLKPSSPLKAMIENARARTTARDVASEVRGVSPGLTAKKVNAITQVKKTTTRATKKAIITGVKSPTRPATRQFDRTASMSTASSNISSGTTITRSTRAGTAAKRDNVVGSGMAPRKTTTVRGQAAMVVPTAKRSVTAGRKVAKVTASVDSSTTSGRVLRRRV